MNSRKKQKPEIVWGEYFNRLAREAFGNEEITIQVEVDYEWTGTKWKMKEGKNEKP